MLGLAAGPGPIHRICTPSGDADSSLVLAVGNSAIYHQTLHLHSHLNACLAVSA